MNWTEFREARPRQIFDNLGTELWTTVSALISFFGFLQPRNFAAFSDRTLVTQIKFFMKKNWHNKDCKTAPENPGEKYVYN